MDFPLRHHMGQSDMQNWLNGTIIFVVVYFPSLEQWIAKRVWNSKDGWTVTDHWLALKKDLELLVLTNDHTKSQPSAINGNDREMKRQQIILL